MGYFREKIGIRVDDKWIFTFLFLVSDAFLIAVGLVVYFR